MLLADLAATSTAVAATSARGAKIAALAEALGHAQPDEAAAAIAFLSGDLLQRQTGVGYRSLRDLPTPAVEPSLTVAEVDAAFAAIGACAGAGSQAERRRLLVGLFARATADEQRFLGALVAGGLRQGALEGVMTEAVAKAASVPPAALRRALMLGGDLRQVGALALRDGEAGLTTIRPAGRGAAAADARPVRRHGRRGPREDRPGRHRVEARRGPHPGPPQRRRRRRLHPQPR